MNLLNALNAYCPSGYAGSQKTTTQISTSKSEERKRLIIVKRTSYRFVETTFTIYKDIATRKVGDNQGNPQPI